MIGFQGQVSDIRRLAPGTSVSRALRFQRDGLIGVHYEDEFQVTVIASNVLVFASTEELLAAVVAKFGGKCERVQFPNDPASVVSIEFTVPVRQHLRNPANFLLSVQRKLVEVVNDLDKVHA